MFVVLSRTQSAAAGHRAPPQPQPESLSSPPPEPPAPKPAPVDTPKTPSDSKPADTKPTPKPNQPEAQEQETALETPQSEDFTLLPRALESKADAWDADSSLRPTIIHTRETWSRTSFKSPRDGAAVGTGTAGAVSSLGKTEQRTERNRAFDLLDALTKSGDIEIADSELHVLIASTHTFDKSAVMTVVQDNINPIEKLERSSLIVASTIHGLTTEQLVQPNQMQRLALCNLMLIEAGTRKDDNEGEHPIA